MNATSATKVLPPPPWTQQQTIDLLSADPLPATFHWPHREGGERPVVPVHATLRGGYGKWLAEGPAYPGLFELIHDLLGDADGAGSNVAWLASDAIRTAGSSLECWSQFIVLELGALREKHAHQPAPETVSLAHHLRAVRTRPPSPEDLF